jgi:hypothetical protein
VPLPAVIVTPIVIVSVVVVRTVVVVSTSDSNGVDEALTGEPTWMVVYAVTIDMDGGRVGLLGTQDTNDAGAEVVNGIVVSSIVDSAEVGWTVDGGPSIGVRVVSAGTVVNADNDEESAVGTKDTDVLEAVEVIELVEVLGLVAEAAGVEETVEVELDSMEVAGVGNAEEAGVDEATAALQMASRMDVPFRAASFKVDTLMLRQIAALSLLLPEFFTSFKPLKTFAISTLAWSMSENTCIPIAASHLDEPLGRPLLRSSYLTIAAERILHHSQSRLV